MGLNGTLQVRVSGRRVRTSCPPHDLMPLMAALSHASAKSARIQKDDRNLKHVLPCEWWSFGLDEAGEQLILSFRVSGGLELSFQVPRDRIQMMREKHCK